MVELPRKTAFQPVAQTTGAIDAADALVAAKPALQGRSLLKRGVLALALLAGTAAMGHYGYDYWTTGRFVETTDDAYVKADYTTIAPKVSGYISQVLVDDNDTVKAGQALAKIDERDFRNALAQSDADVEAAKAAIGNLDAEIVLQQSLIEQARATIAAAQATLTFAEADASRYRDLVKTGAGTVQRAQQTEAIRSQSFAQLQRDQAAFVAAQKKVAVLASQRDQALAQRDRSLALRQQAELNLSYTTITAPVDGTVGARSLRVGQFVSAGTQLMAVVPLHDVYVVANFKETQLAHVRDGQPVEIKIDSFPGLKLTGHVDSLSPASGLEFSLLPPDNATGNFTKIVQRIPVKIRFDSNEAARLLRAGMSVEPAIDTKQTVIGEAKVRQARLAAAESRAR